MDSRKRGEWGEHIALDYLQKRGYDLLESGFRCRFGEIDLILKDKNFLIFAEVKTRKNADFAHAREFVSRSKQKKIIATANYWLLKRPTELQPRFDVIEVYAPDGVLTKSPEINHIENAFGINL